MIHDQTNSSVCIVELTIPFETNQVESHNRKVEKYSELVTSIESKGYNVKFYAILVGSRGYITSDNIKHLISIFHNYKSKLSVSTIRSTICEIVLVASDVVYHSKHDPNWIDPSFVKF